MVSIGERAALLLELIVVEPGTSAAAPIGAQILGELGAFVVKFESPGGDDARHSGSPLPQQAFGSGRS
jgi:crotonobetainyl-CoA:carnitine CoA-transferase CaiB-like acyl-CoA transferase